MVEATSLASQEIKKVVGKKKSSMAAAGAEVIAAPAKMRLKDKDPLQNTVFQSIVIDSAPNAFITGLNGLRKNLDVSKLLNQKRPEGYLTHSKFKKSILIVFSDLISSILLQDDDSSDGDSSTDSTRGLSPKSKKAAKEAKKRSGSAVEGGRKRMPDAAEANNIYVTDPNQLDLIKGISSMELLNIAEKFDQYPGEELDL